MLRRIIYANTNILDDYLASIDGGVYEEKKITQNSSSTNGINGGIKASGFSIGANKGNKIDETVSVNAKENEASKLNRVIEYLEENKELSYYENITDENSKDIIRNSFIEVLIKPRFSKLENMATAISNVKQMVEIVEDLTDETIIKEKDKKAIDNLQKIANEKNKNSTECVFEFADKKYPLVGNIDLAFLKVSREKFQQECYLLCKVQRKIEKGQSISLGEVLEDIKQIPLNRKQKRGINNKNLSNPNEIKDKINGPAYVVIPIAVYQ